MNLRGLSLQERFNAQFIVDNDTGCHLWIGQKSKRGYGFIKKESKTKLAHRVSYEIHYGQIPDGMFVCHTCDTPGCVNPSHLFLGTPKENQQDMIFKGRMNYEKGDNHHNAKLSADDVIYIFNSNELGVDLAKRFHVSRAAISNIKTGKRWAHITKQANMRAEKRAYGAV